MLENIIKLKKPELKFSVHHPQAMYDIAMNVRTLFADAKSSGHEIVVLCIGTDRSTGDSLGPLIGSKLHALSFNSHVYGTLDDPVHATNLTDRIKLISANYQSPYIMAIDACLGRLESVGCVSLGRGSVKPGAAVNKDLPAVGDAYITGIVNVGGFMEHLVLQSTRLNLVMKMADTIANGLSFALRTLH